MPKFNVTYEIITEESAEAGGAEESGFVGKGLSLRDAVNCVLDTESCHCSRSGIEASCSHVEEAGWITVYNSADYLTGTQENRNLHFPDNITAASRRRVARLLAA